MFIILNLDTISILIVSTFIHIIMLPQTPAPPPPPPTTHAHSTRRGFTFPSQGSGAFGFTGVSFRVFVGGSGS